MGLQEGDNKGKVDLIRKYLFYYIVVFFRNIKKRISCLRFWNTSVFVLGFCQNSAKQGVIQHFSGWQTLRFPFYLCV